MVHLSARDLKRIDVIVLISVPILATLISLLFKTNLLTSTLLFFGVPALYLSVRTKDSIIKSLIFTSVVVFTIGIAMDYLGAINNVWLTTNSISTHKLFGVLPIENPIWAFLYVYNIIIFYEHFLQRGSHRYKNHHKVYLFLGIAVLSLTLITISIMNSELLLNLPYSYVIFGTAFFLIPLLIFLTSFPRYIHKFAIIASYFIFISLLNELTALQLRHWTFPGNQVIGWVEIFNLRFPFEEFFFFIIIGSLAILSYYEYFYDDRK